MPYSERPKGYHEPLAEERKPFWADLYTWSMAQALHTLGKMGAAVNYDMEVSMDGHIRKTPYHQDSFALAAGQDITAEWLDRGWNLNQDQVEDMLTIQMQNPETGELSPLFTRDFLETRGRDESMSLTVDMTREGTLNFGYLPFANVWGKAGQAFRAEVGVLNAHNSQSLFATKAARLKIAANGKPVSELGVRRAHSIGGLAESRAGFIGGLDATSNMEAWNAYKIPMFGSSAHAWIMLHESELEAFVNLGRAQPNNFYALLDTFNTINGAKNAAQANEILKRELGKAHVLKGARFDSGKLAHLSKEAGKVFRARGIRDKVIFAATNDLDEASIMQLERDGDFDTYGVGTKFVTSPMQSALGGVYKLNAARSASLPQEMLDLYREVLARETPPTPEDLGRFMRDVIKLGERPQPGELEKASIPGRKVILRTLTADGTCYNGDIIASAYNAPVQVSEDGYHAKLTRDVESVPIGDPTRAKVFKAGTEIVLPLRRIFERGELTGMIGTIHEARTHAQKELGMLADDHKSLTEPYAYGVGVERDLYEKRQNMIKSLRAL